MQPWSSVWVFTVLILLHLSLATEARKNEGKSKGDWYDVKDKKMRGFTLRCPSAGENGGPIVSLSVAGRTKQCHGLTASMLVQVNSCLWKKTCHLKADSNDRYMLRLYKGTPENCIVQDQPPKNYRITYHCAGPQVPVIDLRAAGGAAEEENAWRGIIRSHEDHPWLYRHRQDMTLTLVRPSATATTFLYTILKLRLYNDVLRVTTGHRDMSVMSHEDDVTNMTAKPIVGERRVKFELEMSRYSTGEEGFVICFQWLTDKEVEMKKDDACKELLSRGVKPVKMKMKTKGRKRRRGRGGRGKKGRKKNNKGRKGKTTTTTTTPRP